MQLFSPNVGLLFWAIIVIPGILFLLAALESALRSEFKENTTKLLWILVIVLIPLFGPLLFFVAGRPASAEKNS